MIIGGTYLVVQSGSKNEQISEPKDVAPAAIVSQQSEPSPSITTPEVQVEPEVEEPVVATIATDEEPEGEPKPGCSSRPRRRGGNCARRTGSCDFAQLPKAPAFDLVQVAPDGSGVLAGVAEPGQQVLFLLDGVEVARGKADASGKFGVLLDFPSSDVPRALSIVTEMADGSLVASEGTVLISPVQTATAEPTPEPKPEPKEEVAAVEVDDAPDEPSVPDQAVDAPEEPKVETAELPDAPAVVFADNSGVTVLQPAPQPSAPNSQSDAPVVANVVIDTITYDAEGDVALSGRGASQGFVRVYLNDQPVKTTRIAENGAWETPLPDVDAGVYRLRIDEVDEDGTVTSRVETPFKRETPEIATALPKSATAVTVQPGFTLWAIARDRFGAGEQYCSHCQRGNTNLMINGAVLYAKDLEKLAKFYAGFAGDIVESQPAEYVVVQGASTELTIVQIPDQIAESIQISTPPTVRAHTPVKLSFVVPSIDDTLESILALGGLVETSAQRWSFRNNELLDVVDPEGNVFQLCQKKVT
ncbi:hypothetical protein GQR58_030108 [Nymphon striatum]|nr:hypothetical protein GQR58_030108 [Nymphon striatum]